VVRDLVDDRAANELHQIGLISRNQFQRTLKEGDPIRCLQVIATASARERDAFVQPQQHMTFAQSRRALLLHSGP